MREKKFGCDTEIGPWFWFQIPKPGFGRTLQQILDGPQFCTWKSGRNTIKSRPVGPGVLSFAYL